MNVPWAASHIVKCVKHCIFFCLLSYSNISSTTLSSPLCFLTRNYSAQRAALIGLITQEFVTHACAHLCLCTRIITDSGSKAVNNDSRGRHRHGISTLRKLTFSAPTFSSYILSLLGISASAATLQRLDSRTNGCNDSSFQCNTKATAALLALYVLW